MKMRSDEGENDDNGLKMKGISDDESEEDDKMTTYRSNSRKKGLKEVDVSSHEGEYGEDEMKDLTRGTQRSQRECLLHSYYIASEDDNILRSSSGMKKLYPDDCGTWVNGPVVKQHYVLNDNTFKLARLKNGRYCTEKKIQGRIEYMDINLQPPEKDVFNLSKYYTVLKRDSNYNRRITRVEASNDNIFSGRNRIYRNIYRLYCSSWQCIAS